MSAASYEARAFGVHSAMPLRTAHRLCPNGVFLPGRFDRYRELSRQVMRIFASYTPLVEPISLDEAFMDVTASMAAFGDGKTIARSLKDRVLDEAGLVVSVGVATNKLCAKVASDLRKPDALVVVPPGGEAAFLAPLAVTGLWRRAADAPDARRLRRHHHRPTGGHAGGHAVRRRFGIHGVELRLRALGVDPSKVSSGQAPKSIGHELTFNHDVTDPARLEATLLDLAESVATRLRNHHMAAGAVQLKLRYEGFDTITRQAPLGHQVRDSEPLYQLAVSLLHKALSPEQAVRLIGLTAINLSEVQQLTLFDATDRTDRIAQSIDAVRERFGEKAITRARLIGHRDHRRPDFGERRKLPPTSNNAEQTLDESNGRSWRAPFRTPVLQAAGEGARHDGTHQDHAGPGAGALGSAPGHLGADGRPSADGPRLRRSATRRPPTRPSAAAHHAAGRDRCRAGAVFDGRQRRFQAHGGARPSRLSRSSRLGHVGRVDRLPADDPDRSVTGLDPARVASRIDQAGAGQAHGAAVQLGDRPRHRRHPERELPGADLVVDAPRRLRPVDGL